MASCIKLAGNEVLSLEHPKKYVLNDTGYFIVRIENLNTKTIKDDAIFFLTKNNIPETPKAAHIFRDVLVLFYILPSSLCRGLYNEIISYFSAFLAIKHNNPKVKCNVVEFESGTQLYAYLVYQNYCLYLEFILSLSPKLSTKDVLEKTQDELYSMLQEYGVNIKDYTPIDKYGEVIKMKSNKTKSISGFEDARYESRYMNFIYGCT